MSYIRQEKREVLDPIIDELIDTFRQLQSDDPTDNTQANISYVLSRLLDKMYIADFQEINNALGMLLGVALEYYRRVGAPYQAQAAFDNDVYNQATALTAIEEYVERRDED